MTNKHIDFEPIVKFPEQPDRSGVYSCTHPVLEVPVKAIPSEKYGFILFINGTKIGVCEDLEKAQSVASTYYI